MKKLFLTLFSFVFATSIFAFGSVELPESDFSGNFVITADKVDPTKVILVDARGETGSTIEGSVVVHWKQLATCDESIDGKPGDANWGVILDKPRLDKKLGELGLDMNKPIVVFANDEKGWGEEGRITWQLTAVGYSNVKFVDGGFNALCAAGLKTAKSGAKLSPVKVDTKPVNLAYSIDTETLKTSYDSFKIVDVRKDDEYNGAAKYGEAKGGRLPGAIQIRYNDLFQSNGLLKSNAEIEKLFSDAGLKKSDKIVTYCTSGIRSAYMQLVMEMLGYTAQNYDESFHRWCKVYDVEQ